MACLNWRKVGKMVLAGQSRVVMSTESFMLKIRLEIAPRKTEMRALRGETFAYAWWFFLSSYVVPSNNFFHIFQVCVYVRLCQVRLGS